MDNEHSLNNMQGFVKEVEPTLVHKDFQRSNVFSVFRREGSNEFNSVVFVREHLVQVEEKVMKEFWNNSNKTTLYVNGPPGCGKTCFFYLWARLRSVKEGKRVLIVQYRKTEATHLWIRELDGTLWRFKKAVRADKLGDKVSEILEEAKDSGKQFDLCIHDGVIGNNSSSETVLSTLQTAIANDLVGKVVHVTSLAFHLSTGGQRLDSGGPILELSFDSWCLEDYFDAINCDEFAEKMIDAPGSILRRDKEALENSMKSYQQANNADEKSTEDTAIDETAVDTEMDEKANIDEEGDVEAGASSMADDGSSSDDDLLEQVSWTDVVDTKFYYAGGSARFMFEFLHSELRSFLDRCCSVVPNAEWKYFAEETVSPSTPTAVNTLLQRFGNKISPVSKYVLFKAYEKCKTELVQSLAAVARSSNNPALKGWAFELEQIDLIRLSLESNPQHPEYITNNKGLIFRPSNGIDFSETALENGNVDEDGTIIWCLK